MKSLHRHKILTSPTKFVVKLRKTFCLHTSSRFKTHSALHHFCSCKFLPDLFSELENRNYELFNLI